MKIAVASDHAGFKLKEIIKNFLKENFKFEIEDFGTNSEESCDYPDYAKIAALNVAKKKCKFGIIICGTGIGASIVANKIPGIRAALCSEPLSAKFSRSHNNANILCLGARIIGEEMAKEIVKVFLEENFSGGRHKRRIKKIKKIEEEFKNVKI
jgi:ribose 5-phosphate isomerase B